MTTPSLVRFHDVRSADGTRVRAWSNDAAGPSVLLCNGLGTSPQAWPSLTQPDSGVHLVSWNHRGVGGSERPASGRVDLDSYVEDAIAVMDDAGLDSAVLLSWSTGVTVAFELAYRFPERVKAIMAVCGVPGDTFSTMLRPWHVPAVVAKPFMTSLARATLLVGYAEAPFTQHFPWTRGTTRMLQQTGAIDRHADSRLVQPMLKDFFTTHPAWYAHLAMGVSEHSRVPLSGITVPTTFLAGRRDLLTSSQAMRTAAERVQRSRFVELDATHFIPVEQPEVVHEELLSLISRAG